MIEEKVIFRIRKTPDEKELEIMRLEKEVNKLTRNENANDKQNFKKVKYLQVSDVIQMTIELNFSEQEVVKFLRHLHHVANLRVTSQVMSQYGRLHCQAKLLALLAQTEPQNMKKIYNELLVATFKEAVRSNQYVIAMDLVKRYELLLADNIVEIGPTLI